MIATAPQNQTEPKKEQFFRATPEELKQSYKAKIFNAEAYLYSLIKAKRAAGWEWRLNIKQFCREWEIAERSFYRALSKLRAKNFISWRSGDNTVVVWWGKEVAKTANVHSSDSANSPNPYIVMALPDVAVALPDVAVALPDVAEQNAEPLAVAESCNPSYSLQIDPKINTDFHEVCVGLEKFLDQEPEGDQQKNQYFQKFDDEHEINQDPTPQPPTTLLEETNQDPTPEYCTTLLDDVEASQNDETTHEGKGFAAPRHKTLQESSQKEKWICPGPDAEKAAFLKWKGELLAKEKKCLPVEGRTAALGWANRNPDAANLLWEDWQKWKKQKVEEAANPNTAIATIPDFFTMSPEGHTPFFEKFINLGGEAFIALCPWYKYWLDFATTPGGQKRIPGMTPEILKQIKETLKCCRI